MSDNIFPFPSDRARKDQNLLRMKVRDIETSGPGKRGLTLKGSERLKAAKFLRDLIDRVRDRIPGMTTAAIEERIARKPLCAGFRLERWTLPRRYSEVTEEAVNQLRGAHQPGKSLRVYTQAIEALAELLNEDPWQLKAELLQQTRSWKSRRPDKQPDDKEPSERLAFLIDVFSSRIAREHGLQRLLLDVAQVPGIWNFRGRTFDAHNRYVPSVGCPLGFVEEEDEMSVSPFPAVPIVRIPYAYVDGPLLVGTVPSARPISREQLEEPFTDFAERQARTILYREISLAIGPVNRTELGALLRTQACTAVCFLHESEHEPEPIIAMPAHDVSSLTIGRSQIMRDGWRRIAFPDGLPDWQERCVARLRQLPEAFDSYPLEYPDHHYESWYFSYTAASADYVNHWFGSDNALGPVKPWSPFRNLDPEDRPTWYARGPGRYLELALFTGELEARMATEIERLRDAHQRNEKDWRERVRAATETLLERWESSVPQPPQDAG